MKPTICIATGGGGHFAAALPVIEQLQKFVTVTVIGRKHTFEGDKAIALEYETAKQRGIAYIPFAAPRVQRRFTLQTLFSLATFPQTIFRARAVLQQMQPSVVVSFGGYTTVPIVLAAWMLRLPILLHEQTPGAGLANKIAAPFATKILLSWESSQRFFPQKKTVVTGLPVKSVGKDAASMALPTEKKPLILVTGGSGGSHAINMLIHGCLVELLEDAIVVHQTGDAKEYQDFAMLQQVKKQLPENLQKRYIITKFFDPESMITMMRKATLVIGRSGMNTTVELLAEGKPSLLIPLPYGQKKEQELNAQILERVGLGKILDQQTATPEKLHAMIRDMLVHIETYTKHAAQAKALIKNDAAVSICQEIRTYLPKTYDPQEKTE